MSLMCKIGLHKPDESKYAVVRRQKGRHKWHRNYVICERCGKPIASISFHKKRLPGEKE